MKEEKKYPRMAQYLAKIKLPQNKREYEIWPQAVINNTTFLGGTQPAHWLTKNSIHQVQPNKIKQELAKDQKENMSH